jgi:transcriptional regulator with XRE-family HTH domain
MADLTYADSSNISFATVQPHSFQPIKKPGTPGKVEKIKIENIEVHPNLKQLMFSEEPAGQHKLEEADIVVVGGAGLGNADGFGLARKLSAAIGGEMAGTRPAVINHWIDEERMLGQTGRTVRPELLFSVATSGAIQYTVGIMESDTIVAINRDPKAPIFEVADYGIVADAKTFLPILTAKLKQVVMRNLADVLSEAGGEDEPGHGFGEKIRKIRESHQWTIEDMARQTGQTPETIRQVESDGVVPSVSFLLKLSRALNVDPGTFLRDEEKAAIKDQRAQAFVKRAKSFNYQTLTPGAENEHLRGFMITIEPYQDHKPVALKHEGEEFVYVMAGDLELTLDNKKNHLKPGESMHFNSETPHKMKSLSKETTRCLVVLYTP